MPAEVSLFFLRLIHSNLGMPLKALAGMLVILLPGNYNFVVNRETENVDRLSVKSMDCTLCNVEIVLFYYYSLGVFKKNSNVS